jgi:uncharacterized protein (TIGR02588 family)
MPESDDDDRGQESGGGTAGGEYALGALLVVLLVAFLGYQAVAVRESGPEPFVEVTEVEQAGAGFAVHVRVGNDGGTTAEAVHLSGELLRDGRQVDQASASISYVPPESRRDAVLVFSEDPRTGQLTVGPVGYKVA